MIKKRWMREAAQEIQGCVGVDETLKILQKHCPMEPDTLYEPVRTDFDHIKQSLAEANIRYSIVVTHESSQIVVSGQRRVAMRMPICIIDFSPDGKLLDMRENH